jgi:lipopolysaccharide export system protein LptA
LLKGLHYNEGSVRALQKFAFSAVLVLVFCGSGTGKVEYKSIAEPEKTDKKIQIKADRLVADLEANQAEFSGNVRVTQGNTVLTADMLQIYYRENSKDQKDTIIDKGSIDKLEAHGNVIIQFGDGDATASAETVEYIAASDELALSGRNSTVARGDSTISGSKLIFYRSEGRIRADGDGTEKVRVVFSTRKKFFE